MSVKVLVVEDEALIRANLVKSIRKFAPTEFACDSLEALRMLEREDFKVALIDLNLESNEKHDGLKVVARCKELGILPIVLTSVEDKKTIEEAYDLGCEHYFSKLNFEEHLDTWFKGILDAFDNQNSIHEIGKSFITNCEKLRRDIKNILELSHFADQNIMITGPTGVGKSKIAKIIHQKSSRKGAFVHVSLNEIPDTLLESELFGHKKGAFTGAHTDHIGLLERANGGTLFLDEIGTLPITIQKKLLRVLEEKTFNPIGSKNQIYSDFRLITATCDDLSELIQKGEFRLDFYFRIKGAELYIPALKERREDIMLLIEHFISQSVKKISLSKEAQKTLQAYDWFGNVREVKNCLNEITSKAKGRVVLDDLPKHIINNSNPIEKTDDEFDILSLGLRQKVLDHGLPAIISEIEKDVVLWVYEKTNGKINEVGRQLKLSKSMLYRILRELEADGAIEPK